MFWNNFTYFAPTCVANISQIQHPEMESWSYEFTIPAAPPQKKVLIFFLLLKRDSGGAKMFSIARISLCNKFLWVHAIAHLGSTVQYQCNWKQLKELVQLLQKTSQQWMGSLKSILPNLSLFWCSISHFGVLLSCPLHCPMSIVHIDWWHEMNVRRRSHGVSMCFVLALPLVMVSACYMVLACDIVPSPPFFLFFSIHILQ